MFIKIMEKETPSGKRRSSDDHGDDAAAPIPKMILLFQLIGVVGGIR